MKQNKKCIYCDVTATTKDHVPSKTLLEKPYPNNLMTIDACSDCNKSFSLDEEYFLNVLAFLSDSPTMVARTEPGGNLYRSWERSDKLYDRIINSLGISEDGRVYLNPEGIRLNKVVEKYAFGLYFYRYKRKALMDNFKCIGFYPFNAEETRPSEVILLTHNEKFQQKKWTHIQPNVFSYIVVRDWRRNNQLTMIFHIHNTAWAVIKIPYPTSQWRTRKKKNQLKLFP